MFNVGDLIVRQSDARFSIWQDRLKKAGGCPSGKSPVRVVSIQDSFTMVLSFEGEQVGVCWHAGFFSLYEKAPMPRQVDVIRFTKELK